jgi:heme exporter protein B
MRATLGAPMFRDALAVLRKDVAIEWQSRVGLWQVLPFGVLTLILFAFAFGPRASTLTTAAPGLFWLGVLFSTVLLVGRSASLETGEGIGDTALLSGVDPAGVFLGKAAAVAVQLFVLELVLGVGVVALFSYRATLPWVAVVSVIAGTIGLSAAGSMYGALSAGARASDTLLPMLVLPVVAPVLIAGVRSWQVAQHGPVSAATPWLNLLAVFAIVYVLLGVVLYGPLQETS